MHRLFSSGLIALLAIATGTARADTDIAGNWINPRGSVMVTTRSCQGGVCGWVRWASSEAEADAADAGVPHLVGTELLQDYQTDGPGRWRGQVFVPDLGRRFSSTIRALDANHVKISGCLMGSWICKSQVWSRPGGR